MSGIISSSQVLPSVVYTDKNHNMSIVTSGREFSHIKKTLQEVQNQNVSQFRNARHAITNLERKPFVPPFNLKHFLKHNPKRVAEEVKQQLSGSSIHRRRKKFVKKNK